MKKIQWLSFDDKQLESEFLKIKEELAELSFINIKSVDDLKEFRTYILSNFTTEYFKSEYHKIAFCLSNYESTVFNDVLKITRRHFVDKKLAKSWMTEMQKTFHPDMNVTMYTDIDFESVSSGINRAYGEMVGKK